MSSLHLPSFPSHVAGAPRALPLAASLATLLFLTVSACSSSKDDAAPEPAGSADASSDAAKKVSGPPECRNPTPVPAILDKTATGFVNCEGGVLHRAEVHACQTRLPRTTLCGFAPLDGGPAPACRADTDCTTKANGFCTTSSRSASCYCDYGCNQDSDCGPGNVCVCGEPQGQCAPATCTSDADCGGLLCLRSNDLTCGKTFACQAPMDECTSNADCKPPASACTLENGRRTCKSPGNCP